MTDPPPFDKAFAEGMKQMMDADRKERRFAMCKQYGHDFDETGYCPNCKMRKKQ